LDLVQNPSISVKLSALHPRYQWAQSERVVPALVQSLKTLCLAAQKQNVALTIDAEECDRLNLSIEILQHLMTEPELKNWQGLGLAVQAYDKRCFALIDDLANMAQTYERRLRIRLVKGAYWDTEIKRAQIAGLDDYPVFTRKVNTDLSYLACAQKLLAYHDILYPMFATHNAHTVAAILDLTKGTDYDFEFQRLHGMGAALGQILLKDYNCPVAIYAPVGQYGDLLPYLVRRMLENGANTSFVQKIRDESVSPEWLSHDFVTDIQSRSQHHHPHIPKPKDIFKTADSIRENSKGYDLAEIGVRHALQALMSDLSELRRTAVTPIIAGQWPLKSGGSLIHMAPQNQGLHLAEVWDSGPDHIEKSFKAAREAYPAWSGLPAFERATILQKIADRLSERGGFFIGLLQYEAGKTLPDAVAELREAIDFCRYYAASGESIFSSDGQKMKSYTGEDNHLILKGRGTFVCISPWNFPLAIFTGQIMAALMAGNCVIAKPAEQTPIIAFYMARLMVEAGIPAGALSLVLGDGRLGAALVAHRDVAGVAFTGSTEAARQINQALAAKDGPIVPLIAETGGQNAMIIDSSALLEQVVDDVVLSAFGSTGQRCSALRVLYVQSEIFEKFEVMLKGAMSELVIGDPLKIETDIGPVIDKAARDQLQKHIEMMKGSARLVAQCQIPGTEHQGFFIPPHVFEIKSISDLSRENFGPILHLIRYTNKERAKIIEDINGTGYGLTFGAHSRIQARIQEATSRVKAGNIYINRSMIGAVVGVQPFGGAGLSGTGPKAGGPHYLSRFATEVLVSDNITVTGGNLELINLGEDT
jgi:RHH-type proline utilization regulon transcriptional repressor/proline dehydrogenase/delta 1-pyrroline-5-carboxylate dehydrogenase